MKARMSAKANTTQDKAAITGGAPGGGGSHHVLALAASASIQLEKQADLPMSCPEHLYTGKNRPSSRPVVSFCSLGWVLMALPTWCPLICVWASGLRTPGSSSMGRDDLGEFQA